MVCCIARTQHIARMGNNKVSAKLESSMQQHLQPVSSWQESCEEALPSDCSSLDTWLLQMIRGCSYPEALWGPLTLPRSFCWRKKSKKQTTRVQSAHREASNSELREGTSVRWRRCVPPGYMLLSSPRVARTMYPRSTGRISHRFNQLQRMSGGGIRKKKENPAKVLLKSCWKPAESALQRGEKTTVHAGDILLRPWPYRKADGNTVPANSGEPGPLPAPWCDSLGDDAMPGLVWRGRRGRWWSCQPKINEQAASGGQTGKQGPLVVLEAPPPPHPQCSGPGFVMHHRWRWCIMSSCFMDNIANNRPTGFW